MNKNFYMLSDDELEKIYRASKITMTDYELIGNFAPTESLINVIEDLLLEIDGLEEKYEELKTDLEENYRHIPVSEQVGISNRDFI
jgi:hypothetical protein